jgi:hypothetical protein
MRSARSAESTSQTTSRREFTNEELTEIIREAARRSHSPNRGKVSYEELMSIGGELGIDRAAIESAVNDIGNVKKTEQARIRKKLEFFQHFMIYGVVISALFLINLITSREHWWFLYPAIGWGIGIGCHATTVYFSEKAALHGITNFNDDEDEEIKLEIRAQRS